VITIVGGGISGLALAYLLKEKGFSELLVLEAEERPGGKVKTEKADGFQCEWGVNGFLDNAPKTLELAQKLSLTPLRSSDAARKRYIYIDGKLRLVPENPKAFLTSDILSLPGKLRIGMEPFIKPNPEDETVADFARRRLGREALERLIDPMASGVFAGDPEKMSVAASFPKIKNLERKYGSLIKGMIKMGKEAKKAGKGPVGAGPGGTLTSFASGMEEIIVSLRQALGDKIKIKSRAESVEKLEKGFRIHLRGGSWIETETAVLACPAYESASILMDLDKGIAASLNEIEYPALSVISLGYTRKAKVSIPTDYFGFLVPARERRKILGTLFDSSIFPVRAPSDSLLLRIMAGGARASALAMKDDEVLIKIVLEELEEITGLREEPDFARVFRHERAIPQYKLGHTEKVQALEEGIKKYPGLHLHGNSFKGISLNDCVANSYALAERMAAEVGRH
jgi:oxygen-dependent protoporphyrinogen oxidase